MLKLWGEVRGVMGGDGEKCEVAVLGIWGSRKWVAGERGTPSGIHSVHGCAAPDGVRCDPRSLQTPNAIRDARGHMAFGRRRARFATSMAARRLQTSGAICVDRGCMAPRVPSTIRSS